MFTKRLSLALAIQMLLCVGARPAFAARQESAEARQVAAVKASVAKRGTGEKARVTVELRDRRKVNGYISQTDDDGFVVTDRKTGQSSTIDYTDVRRVSGTGLSKGARIGIIAGIGAGVAALVFGLAVKDALDDFGRP